MADKAVITSSTLTDIATAIRGKNGETGTYLPSAMAAKITAISTGYSTCLVSNSSFSNASYGYTLYISENISIGSQAFRNTTYSYLYIVSIYISYTGGVIALGSNAFMNMTPSNIYVPSDLVSSYKSATNWSSYASRISALT